MNPNPQTNERDESEYPQAWRFDEDGLVIEGHYRRLDEAPSAYGRRAIVVLDLDGTERAIWLAQAALQAQFAEELERRGARDFNPGERIRVARGAEKKTSVNDRAYWPFRVDFVDAPRRSAADVLGVTVDDEPSAETDGAEEEADDDSIPF